METTISAWKHYFKKNNSLSSFLGEIFFQVFAFNQLFSFFFKLVLLLTGLICDRPSLLFINLTLELRCPLVTILFSQNLDLLLLLLL
jgi:hypothetical protein